MAKILWIIHNYPPYQNAGAEWMAKEINDYLLWNGHEITVNATQAPKDYGYDNYKVVSGVLTDRATYKFDCIITHLDEAERATELASKLQKPCINILHHSFEQPFLRRTDYHKLFLVSNSAWVAENRNYPHHTIILRPPVNPDRFKDIKYNWNGYVTLVNCNMDKGAHVFQNIARGFPDLKFLAVKGAHGQQIPLKAKNLIQWECQEDIKRVFEQTAILLIPSIYESYGRIAVEAMSCGIPVIAADTPGLRESIGQSGWFASRNHIPSWHENIRVVQDKMKHLKTYINDWRGFIISRDRAAELWKQSRKELSELNKLINSLI